MRQRLLLGPVIIVLLVAMLWLDERLDAAAMPWWVSRLARGVGAEGATYPPGVIVLGVMVLASVLAAREMSDIFRSKAIEAPRRMHSMAAVTGLLVSCLVPAGVDAVTSVAAVSTAAVAVFVAALLFHSRHASYEGVVASAGGVAMSFVYLGLAFGFLLAIRREHSAWVLLYVIAVIKACDTGAYFTGKAVGRRKLIEWLSPGKTWEGLWGGIATAAAVGALGAWVLGRWDTGERPLTMHPAAGAVMGVVFALLGHVGDLLMSLLKRDAAKKDSGSLLPGFGGVLDVLDSPILVAPAAFWLLRTAA
jgi:phosphatidate cytidylyltransferase